MSGPSLRKQDAHESIHDAALGEAVELRHLLKKCLDEEDMTKAISVAEIIIEHWESRTLKHAQAEEEGLYKDAVKDHPDLSLLVCQLTRDHDLMRKIVDQMKGLLYQNEVDERMIALIDSLIVVDSIHNDDEMNKLLPKIEG